MKKHITGFILSLALMTAGCDEWLTVQPETMVTPEQLFATADGFRDALIGCYQLMNDNYNYNAPLVTGTIEDLACQWELPSKKGVEERLTLHEYTDEAVDGKMGRIYQNTFKVLANLSELIQALDDQKADKILEEEKYNQYMGEALGMRAFLQLDLMRLWGPMPTQVHENKKYLPFIEGMQIEAYEYLTYAEYMGKVEKDLNRAERLLHKNEIGLVMPKKAFVNYYAILALQARFNFWMNRKDKALAYGERLMVADTLDFFPIKMDREGEIDYQKALAAETIWSYEFSSKESVQLQDYNFRSYVLSDLYGNVGSDTRLNFWRLEPFNSGDEEEKMHLSKYDVTKDKDADKDELVLGNVPLIRMSEIYLMLIEISDTDKANALFQEYCEARNIPYEAFASRGEMLKRLELEYRREFVGEGQMFYAYKRWGTVHIPRCKRGCGESAYVPPIPRKEFELNN